ncbi:MAG: hypothetical protein J0M07_03790 [Anaerolineae bacterium]|nr:hypothetical protein [Anaerolineae bacterium]
MFTSMMGPEEEKRRWERIRSLSVAMASELGVLAAKSATAKNMQTTMQAFALVANIEVHDGKDLSSGN